MGKVLGEAAVAVTKETRQRRERAARAALTLLGIIPISASAKPPASAPAPLPSTDRWTFDTSFTRYSESERITVIEPQIGVRRDFAGERSLNILVTVDTISGSTPLGTLPATANTAPNTVTNASGRAYNPIIGKVPLSDMTDTRIAIETSWQQPLAPAYTGIFGVTASRESDYLSLGSNVKLSRDFNQKNTTLSFGIAPEFNSASPRGGLPVEYANAGTVSGEHDEKWLLSGVLGLTQVLSRRLFMQLNYGLTHERGYLNDPYKQISVINAGGDPLSAIYEKRPGKRTEQSFYWLTRYNIWAQDVFGLGLRYYTDDWGIRSQTLDFTFRRQSTERFYWEPHVRYYHQSAADFHRLGLLSGQALPAFASADQRLNQFDGVTFGLQFGYRLQNDSLLIVRAEYYTQNGESKPKEAVGAQKAYDLFPTLNASILQVEYQFDPSKLWSKTPRF